MGSASDSPFCASDLALKVTSNRKTFNIKVVRLVEASKYAFGRISSEAVYCHKKDPQGAASLN